VNGLETGLLAVELPPLEAEPRKAPAEIFFLVSSAPHLGQTGILSASEKLTILSKFSPQLGH
jgi:hypothetical protein